LAHCNVLFGPGIADDFALAPDRFSNGCALVKPRNASHFWRRRQISGRQAWCEVVLDNAKATILNRKADLAVKKAQNARREALTSLSTSVEEKQVFDGNAKMAQAAYASAKAARSQAEINLQRTEVRSPGNG
jgi:multidrug resistance efflux pump